MSRNPLINKHPKKLKTNSTNKSAGILDDYAVRKDISSRQGNIGGVTMKDGSISGAGNVIFNGSGLFSEQLQAVETVRFYENLLVGGNVYIDGQIKVAGASRFRATRGTSQTIPTATITVVQYDTENFDNLGEYDNSTNYRFQPEASGYYFVNARILFLSSSIWTTGERARLFLYKNGVLYSYLDYHEIENGGTLVITLGGSDIIYLTSSDYIDIRVDHNAGADATINADSTHNYFSAHKLS